MMVGTPLLTLTTIPANGTWAIVIEDGKLSTLIRKINQPGRTLMLICQEAGRNPGVVVLRVTSRFVNGRLAEVIGWVVLSGVHHSATLRTYPDLGTAEVHVDP